MGWSRYIWELLYGHSLWNLKLLLSEGVKTYTPSLFFKIICSWLLFLFIRVTLYKSSLLYEESTSYVYLSSLRYISSVPTMLYPFKPLIFLSSSSTTLFSIVLHPTKHINKPKNKIIFFIFIPHISIKYIIYFVKYE